MKGKQASVVWAAGAASSVPGTSVGGGEVEGGGEKRGLSKRLQEPSVSAARAEEVEGGEVKIEK